MQTLMTIQQLKALRNQAKTVQGQIKLQNQAQALWLVISNNDILNQKIGMSAVEYTFDPVAQGGSLIYAQTRELGFFKSTYLELSAQWLPPHYSCNERIFEQGFFQYLRAEKRLEDSKTGGCMLTIQFNYVQRYPFLPLKKGLEHVLNQMLQTIAEIDATLPSTSKISLGFEAFFHKPPSLNNKLNNFIRHGRI